MRYVALLILLAACSHAAKDAAQCRAVSESSEAVRRCLIVLKNWDASAATQEAARYQAQQDSLLNAQRRACFARGDRWVDSIRALHPPQSDAESRAAHAADSTARDAFDRDCLLQ